MIILNIPVSTELQQWIESIVYLEGKLNEGKFQMVPRNYSAMFFMAPDSGRMSFSLENGDNFLQPAKVYMAGLGNIPSELRIISTVRLLAVIFKPYATAISFGDRANLFTNCIVPMSEFSSKLRNLNYEIWNAKLNLNEKAKCFEGFLSRYLLNQRRPPDSVIRAYHEINLYRGCLDIEEVANRSFTGNRNLLRNFREYLGISPKQYSSALRFNSFLKGHINSSHENMEDCLYHFGYYDFSHLNKDFLKYMGEPPSQIIKKDHRVNKLIL